MRGTRTGGFSLLETLAALVLLALCFGALMRATGSSVALNARAADYTQASLWANGLLDRTFVAEFPSEGVHTGRFDDTYRWTMKVSTPSDTATVATLVPMHLYRIELTVEWDVGGKTLSSRFETLRTVSEKPRVPKVSVYASGDA